MVGRTASRSVELDLERSGVAEALADSLTGPLAQLLGLKEHPVGVAGVVAGAVFKDRGQDLGVIGLVFVDEDFENRRAGEQLGHHDALGRFVGALLVDRGAAGHTEGHHDGAVVLFDEVLGRHGEVLKAGDGLGDGDELLAVTGALGQFVEGRLSHVVASEHGVDDTDANNLGRLLFFTHG